MNEKVIKLADVEEVCDFVRAAGMCDFDIDISDQRMVIDAKSIMGIFSLDLSKPIDLNIHSENDVDEILSKLEPFIV